MAAPLFLMARGDARTALVEDGRWILSTKLLGQQGFGAPAPDAEHSADGIEAAVNPAPSRDDFIPCPVPAGRVDNSSEKAVLDSPGRA
jgi:hypothetical protein